MLTYKLIKIEKALKGKKERIYARLFWNEPKV